MEHCMMPAPINGAMTITWAPLFASFVNLFEKNDYQLVACNLYNRSNCLFIDRTDLISPAFDDVPRGH